MENEISTILINGVEYWFIDGNYFSKQLSETLEVAQSKAKTLRNCVGCFDCTDCQNCNYCNFCSFSDGLKFCKWCNYCQNCEFCNNLNYCKDCSFIIAQNTFLIILIIISLEFYKEFLKSKPFEISKFLGFDF